jgi:hypothetical protein
MQTKRLAPFAVAAAVVVVVAAGAFAMLRSGNKPPDLERPSSAKPEATPSAVARAPGPTAPLSSRAMMGGENAEPPAVTWTTPPGWQSVRNPNRMRLASYRVPGVSGGEPLDVSVSRAGGTPDANIQRWMGQFDGPHESQTVKHVHGLDVTMVDVSGTYRSSGMLPGAPVTPHPDWTLVAAIVPAGGTAYFFRLIGPSADVQSARPSFDALIDSLTPK